MKKRSGYRWARRPIVGIVFALLVAATPLTSTVQADTTIGSIGTGAGQYEHPHITVDGSNGTLYVADQANNRVVVFGSAGNFVRAFGWGVADESSSKLTGNISAELQTCTVTCFQGLRGAGAGQFDEPTSIVVDPSTHEIYVFDSASRRIEKFDAAGNFLLAFGAGVITGGATGSGTLTAGSNAVTDIVTTSKQFIRGQVITGAGIPANTKIADIKENEIILSKPATGSGSGVTLNVAEGPGNVPVNTKYLLEIQDAFGAVGLSVSIPQPSFSSTRSEYFETSESAVGLQAKLEALENVGVGDVAVTGPVGGPFTIEFKGPRFADAHVEMSYFGSAGATLTKIQPGHSTPGACLAANAPSCVGGVEGEGEGQLRVGPEIALGPDGSVYVADYLGNGSGGQLVPRVQKFSSSGVFEKQWLLGSLGEGGRPLGLAVDSSGDFYVASGGSSGAVRKYDQATGEVLQTFNRSFGIHSISLDASGNLFVLDDGQRRRVVYEFDPSGAPKRAIYGSFGASADEADPTASGVYVAPIVTDPIVLVPYPGPGPVVVSGTTQASTVRSARGTLEAQINPEGKATTYHFEYVDEENYDEGGGFSGPNVQSTSEQPVPLENPGDPEETIHGQLAKNTVEGLLPETTYHFRVVAEDSEGHVATGAEGQPFTTLDPLEIVATWATDVGTDSATLHAEANPLGTPAEGYFEYVDEATFEASEFDEAIQVPAVGDGAAPIDFGAGEDPQAAAVIAYPLLSGTSYRYRLIATNHCKADPEVVCTFTGPTRSFKTFSAPGEEGGICPNQAFRIGLAANLPDCRAYEMVSPVEKNGASVQSLSNISSLPAALDQAAADGGSITYSAYKAFGAVASAPYINQYISRRDPGGWATEPISPLREGASIMTYQSSNLDRQYKAFSADLCSGWVVQDARPVLAPGGVDGYPGLYRRDNCAAGLGAYEALTTYEAGVTPTQIPRKFIPELQGTSADGSIAIFRVPDNLTSDSPAQPEKCVQKDEDGGADPCLFRLYEAREGQTHLVCILPNGSPHPGECGAGDTSPSSGGRTGRMTNAISKDGSHIFWSTATVGAGKLYVRIEGSETVLISNGPAAFMTAAADGSKAIYTVGSDLFEFDVESRSSTKIAGGFVGMAGASEDASVVYFVSTLALAPGATADQRNLYRYRAGSGFTYIAGLPVEGEPSPIDNAPINRTSRVSPSGDQLVLMSLGSLTGYDNTDANTGEPVYEVYLFDATAEEGDGKLLCISCNPGGGRPVGQEVKEQIFEERPFAAARIPVWQTELYGSRVMSDDGKQVFFGSFEALAPRDSNGAEDVYEWEAPGSGGCTEQSPAYQPESGGCIYLISSGKSPQGSQLVDVSASGDDVFFKTYASLVPQDPAALDIYDAKVNGGFPVPPPPPAACEGEACQPPLAPPEDATPGSATFNGKGNVNEKASGRRCPKGKHLVRRNGKKRCVKAKQKAGKNGKKRNGNRRAGR